MNHKCPHSDCDYRTVDETTLRKHLDAIHRKREEVKIICPHSGCDYIGVKSCLIAHLNDVHNKSEEEKTLFTPRITFGESEQFIWNNLTVYKKV